MGNTTIPYCHILDATPYLASFGNEIVIGIDDQNCSKSTSLVTFAMFLAPQPSCALDCVQGFVLPLIERRVTGIDEILSFATLAARETSFVLPRRPNWTANPEPGGVNWPPQDHYRSGSRHRAATRASGGSP